MDLVNKGQVTAQKVVLKPPIEAGLSLTQLQMDGQNGDINGDAVTTATLATGVDAGALAAGATRHVGISLDVVGPPKGAQYGGSAASGTPGDPGGCGCTVPGPTERPWAPGALTLLAMTGILRSRRRARS